MTTAGGVTLWVPGPLRPACGGATRLSVSAPTVRDALAEIERRHPARSRATPTRPGGSTCRTTAAGPNGTAPGGGDPTSDENGGGSWRRLARGLPRKQGYFTVLRDAMDADELKAPALYCGTTTGQLWIGRDGGEKWDCLFDSLPPIHCVKVAVV